MFFGRWKLTWWDLIDAKSGESYGFAVVGG